MPTRNYDPIAGFYDGLAKLVYGKTLINAQLYLLSKIPAASHILIAGGGTGWVLEELARIHPSGLKIDFIDASPKMIALAKKRNAGSNTVKFITQRIQDMQFGMDKYDVVFTPFLFDNFTDQTLKSVFATINQQLGEGGIWLYCDFQDTGMGWQKLMLRVMYVFFRVCCGIEASRLPDAATLFSRYRFRKLEQRTYRKNFIIATLYKRE